MEKIVGRRIVRRGRNRTPVIQYRVKWLGYQDHYNQWLSLDALKHSSQLIADYEKSNPRELEPQMPATTTSNANEQNALKKQQERHTAVQDDEQQPALSRRRRRRGRE